MTTLDDVTKITALDPSNVLGSIGMFPDQCLDAWTEARKVTFPDSYRHVTSIVVCGMGGSRFTPRTVRELFIDRITVPYEFVDNYTLPHYVNEHSLVLLSSYSGTTEEVIACGQKALTKGAKIAGLAKGGEVIDFLKDNSLPYYQFDAKFNPCGQPRVGGGYLLFGHIAFLSTLGFLTVADAEIGQAISYAKDIGSKLLAAVPETENEAKQLARTLLDKHVFLVAAEFLRGAVNGFANQINETAKMISDFRYIPELNHHMMEGLKHPDSLRENGLFLFLESKLYESKIQKRFSITKDVVEKQGIATHVLNLKGTTPFNAVMECYVLAGFTTFYLAMLYDTDPVAIPWVDYFKKQLKK